MVLLDMKNTNGSSSPSPLNLAAPKEKPTISFSELLRGASDAKDKKVVQNGSLVLALSNEEKSIKTPKATSKTTTLTSLMQTQEVKVEKKEKEPLELNPKLVATLSSAEIKTLISDAKSYLKSKIQESDGYKKAEIKELPTTLKGLAEMAKKFDIDVSKITLQEVKEHSLAKVDTLKQDNVLKAETPKEPKTEATKEALRTPKDLPPENKEIKTESPKEVIQDKKPQLQEMQKQQTVQNTPLKTEHTEIRADEKQSEVLKEIKATPLFKAQSVTEHATTEQIVQAKVNSTSLKAEQKTPKEKADETLKLLLHGERSSRDSSSLTADFSVNSAKVVAPSLTQENTKSLEKLLQGESFVSEAPSQSKVDSLGVSKADSFEVKINEAKQMIKYLSNDIKNAIDEYKSPFTRVKVQLNPQHLGEVDLTVVQRGKNLHVSISSNNTAINTLSMNINELKTQLNNSGINSATFNFNSSSQNGDNSSGAFQQQRQNEQKAQTEYSHFENEEAHEEIISSLEIIVPRYI
ncbi:MAG TPA: flagellar hook-length control protein FliK [Sulfurimonas sp.]|uniref:flagellar hook-length control protein FliK n=1 Tax=Sulfurimonas sp. TaxID=2022749 RepID=UPI002B5AB7CD|nr:flagellar hook-length control protein FliK [Sulfurimonas sp.]HUH42927.1 flagellar hook-length control protein FliK [Sulfurimonas sp.]